MHFQANLVPLMLAMTTVVLSNPLAQPSGVDPSTMEGESNSFTKQPRLGRRQVPGYPFIDRFVKEHRAARSTATTPSHETPSQKHTKPEFSGVYTANGPLLFPVGKENPSQDTAGSQPGSPGIASSQPESIPSPSSPAESEAHKARIKKLRRLSSPPGTAMSWFHRDTTGVQSGSLGMPSSQQDSTTSTPTLAESEAHKDGKKDMSRLNSPPGTATSHYRDSARNQQGASGMPSSQQEGSTFSPIPAELKAHVDKLKKLKGLKTLPGTAMPWHYWTRRQAPSDMEENDPNTFSAAHLGNPHKVSNSPSSSQFCGAGSVCTAITIAGEGNSIQGLLPQGLRDLPPAATNQESRHSYPVYSSSPEQSGTTSEPRRPTASNEARNKHHKWSEMLHFTRRMAPHASRADPSQVDSEVNTVPGGPANVVTNSQVCGPSSVCNSHVIANENGDNLQVPAVVAFPHHKAEQVRPPRGNLTPPPSPYTQRRPSRAGSEAPETMNGGRNNEMPINGLAGNGVLQRDPSPIHGGSSNPYLQRRQMEGVQLEGGTDPAGLGSLVAAQSSARAPLSYATNNQRCGDGGVCNSILIANGNSNTVHSPPQRNTDANHKQARVQSLQSDASYQQGGSPILPEQTVFQPTRDTYSQPQTGSPFGAQQPFTPVPGVPGSNRASMKKAHRGSHSSEKLTLRRRQVFARSLVQEPSVLAMAEAGPPSGAYSNRSSKNLVRSSSATAPPINTFSRSYGGRYPGLQRASTGRPRYVLWPDGTVGSGNYRPPVHRKNPYGSEGRLSRRMMPWFGTRTTETAHAPEQTAEQVQQDREPSRDASNTLSNHQDCGPGSVCHSINIAGNGVTLDRPTTSFTVPAGAQPEAGRGNAGPQGRQHWAAVPQHFSGWGGSHGYPVPPPPPPPPPPPRDRAPGAGASLWTSAGQGRMGPAELSADWRAGQGRRQAVAAPRRDRAAGYQAPQNVPPPPRNQGQMLDRRLPQRAVRQNRGGQLAISDSPSSSSSMGESSISGGLPPPIARPSEPWQRQGLFAADLPVAVRPPREAQHTALEGRRVGRTVRFERTRPLHRSNSTPVVEG